MAWLSSNSIPASGPGSYATNTMFNNLANDIRAWGGNVNAGGYSLSNIGALVGAGALAVASGGSNIVTLQTSAVDRVWVTAAGLVGIAQPSPAHFLDVNAVTARIGTTGTFAYLQIGANATDLNNGLIGFESGAFVVYQGRYGGTATERMRIGSAGVGFGMTASSKLAVAGLPVYADNTAATGAGLTAGNFYRTSTGAVQVVY